MLSNLRQQSRLYLDRHPALFMGVNRVRANRKDLLVAKDSEIVIEAFPRSGNTFAVTAFRQAQGRDLRIAHHLHSPAQIRVAVQWQIPALVLLRDPVDAVLSMTTRRQDSSPVWPLRYYIAFHEEIARISGGVVLATFDEVTTDFGPVIRRINQTFRTSFVPFAHTEDNVSRVFAEIEASNRVRSNGAITEMRIARPSSERAILLDQKRQAMHDNMAVRGLLDDAQSIHRRLLRLLRA